jgi:hypothetical protein
MGDNGFSERGDLPTENPQVLRIRQQFLTLTSYTITTHQQKESLDVSDMVKSILRATTTVPQATSNAQETSPLTHGVV